MSSSTSPPSVVAEDQVALSSGVDFDNLAASYNMPPPGPGFYLARRQLWLTPRKEISLAQSQPQQISSSRRKLERLLQTPEAAYSDSCWKNGIEKVWKGLSKGERLKHRLPMGLIVKVVHASWVHDETWPVGMKAAPEPDDALPEGVHNEPIVLKRIAAPSAPHRPSRTS